MVLPAYYDSGQGTQTLTVLRLKQAEVTSDLTTLCSVTKGLQNLIDGLKNFD